jgi:dTMP kinase
VETVRRLNHLAVGECIPHRTYLVDLDPAQGRARQTHAPDRMEREDLDFHRTVRETYLALAEAEPERFWRLDGSRPPGDLAREAWSDLAQVVEGLPRRMPRNDRT